MGLRKWLYCGMRLLWNIYYFYKKNNNYWNDRGVRCVRPIFSYGNLMPFWHLTHSYTTVIQDIYNQCKDCRYYGFYQVNLPVLMIRDPFLIKEVISSECFQPHKSFASPSADPPFTNVPYQIEETDDYCQLKNEILKSLHSKIYPVVEKMKERAKSLVAHFKERLEKRNVLGAIQLRKPFKGITFDITAEVVLGLIKRDFIQDNNTEGFVHTVDLVAGFWRKREDFLRASSYPSSPKMYNLQHYGEKMKGFFKDIGNEALKQWKLNKLRRETSAIKDIVGIIDTDATVVTKISKSKVNLIGELMMTGYGLTARIIAYMTYELALNQNIQNRLQEEVDEIFQNEDMTPISCQVIEDMQYMDMVVSEVLRKWPPYSVTDLQVIKPFTIQPQREEEQPLVLEKGHICAIPVFSIHRDSINFVNPEMFNPERFNNGTEDMRIYLPFGAGPKKYLSDRYNLLEIKILMSYLLRNFTLRPNPCITYNLEALNIKSFHPEPNPFWSVVFKPRQQSV